MPLEASQHVRVGAVAYLAGNTERALSAFARAKQLSLPDQFKSAWEQTTRNPAYKTLLDDSAFVAKVFASR